MARCFGKCPQSRGLGGNSSRTSTVDRVNRVRQKSRNTREPERRDPDRSEAGPREPERCDPDRSEAGRREPERRNPARGEPDRRVSRQGEPVWRVPGRGKGRRNCLRTKVASRVDFERNFASTEFGIAHLLRQSGCLGSAPQAISGRRTPGAGAEDCLRVETTRSRIVLREGYLEKTSRRQGTPGDSLVVRQCFSELCLFHSE